MTKYSESDYQEVRKLHSERMAISTIHRITGMSQTNIRKVLDPDYRNKAILKQRIYWKNNNEDLNFRRKKRLQKLNKVLNEIRRKKYADNKDLINKKRRLIYKSKKK